MSRHVPLPPCKQACQHPEHNYTDSQVVLGPGTSGCRQEGLCSGGVSRKWATMPCFLLLRYWATKLDLHPDPNINDPDPTMQIISNPSGSTTMAPLLSFWAVLRYYRTPKFLNNGYKYALLPRLTGCDVFF
jgi:hypothetical protein